MTDNSLNHRDLATWVALITLAGTIVYDRIQVAEAMAASRERHMKNAERLDFHESILFSMGDRIDELQKGVQWEAINEKPGLPQ